MTGKGRPVRRLPALAALLVSLATANIVSAQTRTSFGSLQYESPGLLVPVVFVISTREDGGEWSVGITGWTLTAESRAQLREGRKLHVFARLTPINANASNIVYEHGRRGTAGEYSALAAEGGVGVEVAHTPRWIGGYRAIVIYQRISDMPDARVSAFWRQPFAGLEVTQQYARVTADERFGSRWDGVKVLVAGRVAGGIHTWSRVQAAAGAGKRAGRFFIGGRGAVFAGASLNVASAFVLGGAWDVPAAEMLPGYRYAEVRLARAATATASVDWRIHGSWEIGMRESWLGAPDRTSHGGALQVATIWRGAAVTAGIAFPHSLLSVRGSRGTTAYASVAAAVIQR